MGFAYTYIEESPWAISEDGLKTLLSIAKRDSDFSALEKHVGQRLSHTYKTSVHGSVGIIPIEGPTFKKANLFTEVSGATSYEFLLRDLTAMVEDPKIKSIVLSIDSPGGEANGCSELAEHIFAARKSKPVAAYIGGQGASAAYWLASACSKIYASETAFIGSIGVQSVVRPNKNSEDLTFVSSLSPNKNRDPSTNEGAKEIQNVVDSLGRIFVDKVAAHRGISPKEVLAKFGQGSVFIAGEALKRGMIDEISTLEGVISKLQMKEIENGVQAISHGQASESHESQQTSNTDSSTALQIEEIERATTQRILDIQKLAAGRVSPEFTQRLIDERLTPDQAALRILQASDADRVTAKSVFQARETSLGGLSGKPIKDEADDLESYLQMAQKSGLVSLL